MTFNDTDGYINRIKEQKVNNLIVQHLSDQIFVALQTDYRVSISLNEVSSGEIYLRSSVCDVCDDLGQTVAFLWIGNVLVGLQVAI